MSNDNDPIKTSWILLGESKPAVSLNVPHDLEIDLPTGSAKPLGSFPDPQTGFSSGSFSRLGNAIARRDSPKHIKRLNNQALSNSTSHLPSAIKASAQSSSAVLSASVPSSRNEFSISITTSPNVQFPGSENPKADKALVHLKPDLTEADLTAPERIGRVEKELAEIQRQSLQLQEQLQEELQEQLHSVTQKIDVQIQRQSLQLEEQLRSELRSATKKIDLLDTQLKLKLAGTATEDNRKPLELLGIYSRVEHLSSFVRTSYRSVTNMVCARHAALPVTTSDCDRKNDPHQAWTVNEIQRTHALKCCSGQYIFIFSPIILLCGIMGLAYLVAIGTDVDMPLRFWTGRSFLRLFHHVFLSVPVDENL